MFQKKSKSLSDNAPDIAFWAASVVFGGMDYFVRGESVIVYECHDGWARLADGWARGAYLGGVCLPNNGER